MPTPPTAISRTETASWTTAASSKTVTVSWLAGDILAFIALSEGGIANEVCGVPTGTGLSFTSQESITASSPIAHSSMRIATATPGADGTSVVITSTFPNNTSAWGFVVAVLRGSGGVGNHTITAAPGATQTISLTPQQANSYILWGIGDWAAAAEISFTPTPTTDIESTVLGGKYTVYAADLADQTSSGATSYGISGAGSGPFTIGAIEIKGTASAGIAEDDSFKIPVGSPIDPIVSVWG